MNQNMSNVIPLGETNAATDGAVYQCWPNTTTTIWPYYPACSCNHEREVGELKAWLRGYMEGRKLTEKSLKRIREKLAEFTDDV